jgi:hypothetical protein
VDLREEAEREAANSTVNELIDKADEAGRSRDVDSAWQHLYRARQELVMNYDLGRLRIVARTLNAEICDRGRLPAWRVEAIRKLLTDSGLIVKNKETSAPHCDLESCRLTIASALSLRNEGVANDYWRLAIIRHYQRILIVIGLPVLTTVVLLLARHASDMRRPEWATGGVPCLLAALLGILGATTSAAQRSTQIHRQRVNIQLASNVATLSRIPIGAVGGLTVWLFSIATADGSINAANLLLAAFGAGFAERLVVQGQPTGTNDRLPSRAQTTS